MLVLFEAVNRRTATFQYPQVLTFFIFCIMAFVPGRHLRVCEFIAFCSKYIFEARCLGGLPKQSKGKKTRMGLLFFFFFLRAEFYFFAPNNGRFGVPFQRMDLSVVAGTAEKQLQSMSPGYNVPGE